MKIDPMVVLHPRIISHCSGLFTDGYYKHAAREAMIQVELCLKETSGVHDKYGVSLITSVFGGGPGIKLRVPFGEEMQKQAEAMFKGAFAYYRNYCAHDGSKVDAHIAYRVLVLASELLDLIGASTKSLADVGGVDGLVKVGSFGSRSSVAGLLKILDGYTLPDDDSGRLTDVLEGEGFNFEQVEALLDCGLIQYVSKEYVVPSELPHERDTLPSTVGWFQLTRAGRDSLASSEQSA